MPLRIQQEASLYKTLFIPRNKEDYRDFLGQLNDMLGRDNKNAVSNLIDNIEFGSSFIRSPVSSLGVTQSDDPLSARYFCPFKRPEQMALLYDAYKIKNLHDKKLKNGEEVVKKIFKNAEETEIFYNAVNALMESDDGDLRDEAYDIIDGLDLSIENIERLSIYISLGLFTYLFAQFNTELREAAEGPGYQALSNVIDLCNNTDPQTQLSSGLLFATGDERVDFILNMEEIRSTAIFQTFLLVQAGVSWEEIDKAVQENPENFQVIQRNAEFCAGLMSAGVPFEKLLNMDRDLLEKFCFDDPSLFLSHAVLQEREPGILDFIDQRQKMHMAVIELVGDACKQKMSPSKAVDALCLAMQTPASEGMLEKLISTDKDDANTIRADWNRIPGEWYWEPSMRDYVVMQKDIETLKQLGREWKKVETSILQETFKEIAAQNAEKSPSLAKSAGTISAAYPVLSGIGQYLSKDDFSKMTDVLAGAEGEQDTENLPMRMFQEAAQHLPAEQQPSGTKRNHAELEKPGTHAEHEREQKRIRKDNGGPAR